VSSRSMPSSAHLLQQSAPGVGGLTLETEQSKHLLPPEVLLFRPRPEDIVRKGKRLIFLNTELTDAEQKMLKSLHEASGQQLFPAHIRPHALRILQKAGGSMGRAMDMILAHEELRLKNLPMSDADILSELRSGLCYVHGRDRSGRPVIVLRPAHLRDLSEDQATKVVLFVCEFVIHHLLVPGRVENYVLVVDLEGCGIRDALQVSKLRIIKRLLEDVYCERSYCIKILHLGVLGSAVNALIPRDKKDKTSFPVDADVAREMMTLCECSQLEARYGGTAPDVKPGGAYPYRFFPNCTGQSFALLEEVTTLHQLTTLEFHEGQSWDTSEVPRTWSNSSDAYERLAPELASELKRLLGKTLLLDADRKRQNSLQESTPSQRYLREESPQPHQAICLLPPSTLDQERTWTTSDPEELSCHSDLSGNHPKEQSNDSPSQSAKQKASLPLLELESPAVQNSHIWCCPF